MDDYYHEQDHFAAIASVLLAGEIQARYVANVDTFSIEVRLQDDGRVLWSNSEKNDGKWGYSIIREYTDTESKVTDLAWDTQADEVAKYIATYDYPVPVEKVASER